ncbi:AMP-binding protein [Salinibacterium sp. ZJ70]|uniref:AMP-binding protein n=1 Tax=Salinibacterium sp. ZJ70 TaxID=2708084 RepID=UPI001424379C|nr:AMP-binding protein [Salinibacterium sp. ZJ70]
MPLITDTTVPSVLRAAAQQHRDHPAIIDADLQLSYFELEQHVHHVARAYLTLGITHTDRVAIWAPNRHEFAVALLAAQTIGASAVPMNTRFTGYEAEAILERSRARMLIVADGFLGKGYLDALKGAATRDLGGTLVPSLPHLETIVTLDPAPSHPDALSWARLRERAQDITSEQLDEAISRVSESDVADIMFTSGTTGLPKGVLSTHRQNLSVARSWAAGANLTPDDRYLIVNPFFQSWGYKAGLLSSVVAGTTMYPLPTFDPEQTLATIERERISVLPGVPTIFTTLIDHPQLTDFDISSLRFAIAGAATVPESLFRDMVEILGFESVGQAYGLTECVVATMSRPNESFAHIAETTGPAADGVEIRIIAADGSEVPRGTDGEIVMRGPNVTEGYFEDAEATAAAFDSDGWFHTGDVGRMDEHGCVKITDRLKDMYIVGGFNVYPAEIENALRTHPAVNESAVVGVPDARMGAVGLACVMLRDGSGETPEELLAYLRERLSNYKVPARLEIVADFPRNAMGKILKNALRDQVIARYGSAR